MVLMALRMAVAAFVAAALRWMSLSDGNDREQKDTHATSPISLLEISGTGEEKAGDAMKAASATTAKVL